MGLIGRSRFSWRGSHYLTEADHSKFCSKRVKSCVSVSVPSLDSVSGVPSGEISEYAHETLFGFSSKIEAAHLIFLAPNSSESGAFLREIYSLQG